MGAPTSTDVWAGSVHPHTLRDVVDALGSVVLEVKTGAGTLESVVDRIVIQDPIEPIAVGPGDLILAVGLSADQQRVIDFVRSAGAAEATSVVLRGPVPEELAEVGERAGVAVLAVTSEVTWGHLHSLLRTVISAPGRIVGTGEDFAPAGDLFTLANAVAAMVGGPVTIEDPQSRVLAFSNLGHPVDEGRRQTILGRRVPSEWIERLRAGGVFAELWSSNDVVEYGGGGHDRLAIAVRAGDEILGSVWAADAGEGFQPSAPDAMREAAAMAALHLVRHRMGEDLERRMRGEVLRSLLEGRGSVEVMAQRLGVEPSRMATVLAFEVSGSEDAAAALSRARIRERLLTYCESYRRASAHVTMNRVLYVLLLGGAGDGEPDEMAMRLAKHIVERSDEATSACVRVAVGSTVDHLSHVTRSRAEADRVLEVLARYGFARRTAHVDDVRAYTALLELENVVAERPELHLRQLDGLARYDDQHGSDYVETLRAYLDAFGDVIQASKAIHVHPNTLRYRLRRLLEISGLDLQNPDERIVIELQLRAL